MNSTEEAEASGTRQTIRSLRVGQLTNRILSASASLVAIAALATALYQAKVARDQAKAAVWPYLLVGNAGDEGYSRIAQNVGLGPAIIGAFEVQVNGHPVRTWREAADSMHIRLTGRSYASTTFRAGVVVPIGGRMDLVNLRDSADIRAFRAGLNANRLVTSVCYCSLYDDCWETEGMGRPRPVKACREDAKRAFVE